MLRNREREADMPKERNLDAAKPQQANKEPDTGTDNVHEPEALGNAAKSPDEGVGDAVAETAKPKAQAAKRPAKKADGAAAGKAEPKKAAAAKAAAGKAAKASSKAVPKKTAAAKEAAGKKAVGKAGQMLVKRLLARQGLAGQMLTRRRLLAR